MNKPNAKKYADTTSAGIRSDLLTQAAFRDYISAAYQQGAEDTIRFAVHLLDVPKESQWIRNAIREPETSVDSLPPGVLPYRG